MNAQAFPSAAKNRPMNCKLHSTGHLSQTVMLDNQPAATTTATAPPPATTTTANATPPSAAAEDFPNFPRQQMIWVWPNCFDFPPITD